MRSNVVFQTDYWVVKLADDQYHLGRCYVDIKNGAPSMSDLSSEEWEDLHMIIQKMENALKKAFGATMFNWSCLMNNAFKEEIPSPHVHFHFRPRYKFPVEFGNETFVDEDFGHHSNRDRKKGVSDVVFSSIIKKIQDNIEDGEEEEEE